MFVLLIQVTILPNINGWSFLDVILLIDWDIFRCKDNFKEAMLVF